MFLKLTTLFFQIVLMVGGTFVILVVFETIKQHLILVPRYEFLRPTVETLMFVFLFCLLNRVVEKIIGQK